MGDTSFAILLDGAGFQAATIILCITGIFYMLMRSKPEKVQSKILLWLLVNVLFSAVCSLVTAFTKGSAAESEVSYAVMVAVEYVYFLLHLTLAPSFCIYMIHITGSNHSLDWRKYMLLNLPVVGMILMVVFNPVSKWIFYFDENRVFHRSPGMIVPYLIGVVYYIGAIVVVFSFWYLMTRRRKIVLVFFFLMVTTGVVLQLLLRPLHTELFTEAVGLVGVMVTIGNEEDVMDQRLHIYNHVALNYDLNVFKKIKHSFCLIIVKIQNPMSLLRFGVTTGVGAVSQLNAEYICSLVPKKFVYIASIGTFVVISDNTEKEYNMSLARTIKERFNHSWHYMERDIKYGAAVMCTEVPKDFDSVEDLLLLINSPMPPNSAQSTDVMYGDMLKHIVRRSRMDTAIMSGLDNRRFEVYYQPVYRTKDLSVCGCEALTRLHDDDFGDIYPEEFLPYAEKSGIIFEIGDYVINEVCSFLSSGIPTEMGVTAIGVNLSVSQCMQPAYAERIMGITSKYNIDPQKIVFEIKEAAAVTDFELLKKFIAEMRNYGFRFSVDNYGIGYSNISTTFSLDIGRVKIDKSLLWDAEKSQNGKIILESTLDMIRRLGKEIMLTGVESEAQIAIAQELGVGYLQGYYFSNPLSQNEFISILKATQLARFEEQKALAASEAMSNFLTSMSHEIRTPINAVLGMDEMILRECDDNRILEYARSIEGAGRTLLSLINDILDLSKLEAGELEITESSYELSTLISDVLNMIRFKAEDKGLELKCEVDPSVPEKLFGDETRIRQILLNLMNNAVKYTDEGSVFLKTSYEKAGKDTIKLMFSIKDTGTGIKPEDKDKLFDKFRRLDTEKNKSVEGSGLGLAITSQLINNMNGAIDVESEYGKGTTFYVIIPQKVLSRTGVGDFKENPVKPQDDRMTDVERYHAPDAEILIVDDTPMNIAVVKALLRRIRVKTDDASGGAECLEKLKKKAYDLILLDYRMPEMDGIEVLKKIKELDDNPNQRIPVIALTANAIAGARERFLAEGFDDYITKPVDGMRLEKMLMVYLPADKIKLNAAPDMDDISDEKSTGQTGEAAREEGISDKTGDGGPSGVDGGSGQRGYDENLGIDYSLGIANCGSEEIYRSILQIFVDDIENKTDAIRQSLKNDDIKRYTVEVHALKSSARTIGAMEVSKLAEELENAGERSDMDRINADTEPLLEMFGKLKDAVTGFDSGPGGAEAGGGTNRAETAEMFEDMISKDAWKDALETVREFAQLMDYDNAAMVLSSLREYNLPDICKKQAGELRNLVDGLKWEKVVERIEQILSEM